MDNPFTYALGIAPFFLFIALIVVGASNAVNLTDGLDGLAIGLMVISAGAMTILTYVGGHGQLADYLQLARNPRTAELTVFCGSMTGACLGFLWYNATLRISSWAMSARWPGRGMGVVAVLIKQEMLLLFVGGVFVLEALSVVLQVGSYKFAQEAHLQNGADASPFRSARLDGSEIIARFWIVGLVLALFALTTLKLR